MACFWYAFSRNFIIFDTRHRDCMLTGKAGFEVQKPFITSNTSSKYEDIENFYILF